MTANPFGTMLLESEEIEPDVKITREGFLRWRGVVLEYILPNGRAFGWTIKAMTRRRVMKKAYALMVEIYAFRDDRDARLVDNG